MFNSYFTASFGAEHEVVNLQRRLSSVFSVHFLPLLEKLNRLSNFYRVHIKLQ
jgi:hypothetical protein